MCTQLFLKTVIYFIVAYTTMYTNNIHQVHSIPNHCKIYFWFGVTSNQQFTSLSIVSITHIVSAALALKATSYKNKSQKRIDTKYYFWK